MLKVDAIASANAAREPFCYLQAQVLEKHDLDSVRADFPAIAKPGIFPLEELKYGPAFGALIGERRYVMMNWLRSDTARARQLGRHTLSAKVKRLIPFFYSGK